VSRDSFHSIYGDFYVTLPPDRGGNARMTGHYDGFTVTISL
jgi:hypothetical protein